MSHSSSTYSFSGQEAAYDAFRPRWSSDFAREALRRAGIEPLPDGTWTGTPDGAPPVVVSMGAGNGADAALFKRLGCKVILVEPNAALLARAQANLETIATGKAEFIHSDAMHADIAPDSVDLIVAAQAAHTLKQIYAEKFLSPEEVQYGTGTEEMARLAWGKMLRSDLGGPRRARVSIWYYNPDPHQAMMAAMHEILYRTCPKYRQSQTPLVNADFFEPKHFQPWIAKAHMQYPNVMPVDVVSLTRDEIADWLSSYSFKPDEKDMARVITKLKREWFDKYQNDGKIEISYIGCMTQGPLRRDAFPMVYVNNEITKRSPLARDDLPAPFLPPTWTLKIPNAKFAHNYMHL